MPAVAGPCGLRGLRRRPAVVPLAGASVRAGASLPGIEAGRPAAETARKAGRAANRQLRGLDSDIEFARLVT